MITRFSTTATSFALAVLLAGCSKTPEQSTATGLTPASSDAAPANDAPAKVVDAPPPPKVSAVTVRAGTPIKIRTETTLSTKTINTGDAFTATLAEPIIVEGQVVAPRGSQVEGVVAESDPGGRVKGVATISVRLTRLRVGNRKIEIHTGTVVRRAHATKRKDAAKVGIGAGIGAAIGAIAGGGEGAAIGAASGGAAGTGLVLATHGEPAVIGSESLLTFKLTSPVTVEPS